MSKPNVLIIADKKDTEFIEIGCNSEHWNLFPIITDYNKLNKKINEIQELAIKNHIDFVLYSRNDQVANKISIRPINRKLRTGYSSFSGIDDSIRVEQMKACFQDFIRCNERLNFNLGGKSCTKVAIGHKGLFSLIFDTEQLGGVKYGLPRILNLLRKYDIKATFFITNLMKKVYTNVFSIILEEGHEIGLHGLWHEYLAGLNRESQKELVEKMMLDFNKVYGANFIGRMDVNTLYALAGNGIEYFMYASISRYHITSYLKTITMPCLINLSGKSIWALPISVETYGFPWFSIRNMINSAICQGKKYGFLHISVLCHPFKDGNLNHIDVTERMINYLFKMGLSSITLKELVSKLPTEERKFPKININDTNGIFQPNAKISYLQTKEDVIGMVPENLMMLWRIIKKGHTIW